MFYVDPVYSSSDLLTLDGPEFSPFKAKFFMFIDTKNQIENFYKKMYKFLNSYFYLVCNQVKNVVLND